MNINQFKTTLPHLLRNRIVPFIHGSQGIGKTQVMGQYCKENGLELVVLHMATMEVGDLIGLLDRDGKGAVKHLRPDWFPTSGQGVVFLDELNRAPTDVLQALFSFILNGVLHTHKLPPGWRVVAAGNYASDRFTITSTTDAAWLSRFCHIDFVPTVEEFTLFAENKNLDEVADFIRAQPSMLELSAKDAGRLDTSFIVPDRRAWADGIGRLEAEGLLPQELQYEVYSGMVGVAAAAAFISWKNKHEKGLSLKSILRNYVGSTQDNVLKLSRGSSKRFDLLTGPIDELLLKLEQSPQLLSADKALQNLQQFLIDIPRELSMKAFVKFTTLGNFYGKYELINEPDYVGKFS